VVNGDLFAHFFYKQSYHACDRAVVVDWLSQSTSIWSCMITELMAGVPGSWEAESPPVESPAATVGVGRVAGPLHRLVSQAAREGLLAPTRSFFLFFYSNSFFLCFLINNSKMDDFNFIVCFLGQGGGVGLWGLGPSLAV
jgi:hypothetical protein